MHLCASKLPPLDWSLPSATENLKEADVTRRPSFACYRATNGIAFAQCWPHDSLTLSGDYIRYTPYGWHEGGTPPVHSTGTLNRLLRCVSIEDSIQEWDADGLKAFVDMLELEPVSFSSGDPLQPSLHATQTVAYNDVFEYYRQPRMIREALAAVRKRAREKRQAWNLWLLKRWR